MSLVSATSFVGGVKEYMFRGVQQLPLVIILITFLFTITTASVAHSTLFVGMSFVAPIYTLIARGLISLIVSKFYTAEQAVGFTHSTADVCNVIPNYKSVGKLDYYVPGIDMGATVPSYWITSLGFFIGYAMTNAIETFDAPTAGDDEVGYEKRKSQALFLLIALVIFSFLVLGVRFVYMGDCESRSAIGKAVGVLFGGGAAALGWYFYKISKACGARSSDLFGVLSQILPPSATAVSPIACSQE